MAYFCLYRLCWCLGPLGEGTSWACSIIHMGDVGGAEAVVGAVETKEQGKLFSMTGISKTK